MTLLEGKLSTSFTVNTAAKQPNILPVGEGKGRVRGRGRGRGGGCCAKRHEIYMVTTTTQTYSDRKTGGQFHGYKLF